MVETPFNPCTDWRCSSALIEHVSHLNWHRPQVRTEKEEPHELVGIYGNQVADLSNCQLAHGHVGGAQPHDLVVYFCLQSERINTFRQKYLSGPCGHTVSGVMVVPVWPHAGWCLFLWPHSKTPAGRSFEEAERRKAAQPARTHSPETLWRKWNRSPVTSSGSTDRWRWAIYNC